MSFAARRRKSAHECLDRLLQDKIAKQNSDDAARSMNKRQSTLHAHDCHAASMGVSGRPDSNPLCPHDAGHADSEQANTVASLLIGDGDNRPPSHCPP